MKLWIDDVRPAPEGYILCKCVDNALLAIGTCQLKNDNLEISLDHDAGDYAKFGGDFIEILDTLEEASEEFEYWKEYIKNKITFHIHSMNPVGVQNMRRIIQKNGWKEV